MAEDFLDRVTVVATEVRVHEQTSKVGCDDPIVSPRLVEPDVSVAADAQQLNFDGAHVGDQRVVLRCRKKDVVGGSASNRRIRRAEKPVPRRS
jgi:hypothetical protein